MVAPMTDPTVPLTPQPPTTVLASARAVVAEAENRDDDDVLMNCAICSPVYREPPDHTSDCPIAALSAAISRLDPPRRDEG